MSVYQQRIKDVVATNLNTEGFENLTEEQKNLVYYLTEAGNWGRYIALNQESQHTVPLFTNMISLYENTRNEELKQELQTSLFILLAHNSIYEHTTGFKLEIPLKEETLLQEDKKFPFEVEAIQKHWFNPQIKPQRTVQTSKNGVDIVAESGSNFYENLTTDEVKAFREQRKSSMNKEQQAAPQGLNERLYKDENGEIQRQVISVHDLYGSYVSKIVENLEQALNYTENEIQKENIEHLIQFYKTGDAVDYEKHTLAFVQDKTSNIYFINGPTESYDDPLGVACTFESIVGFRNLNETAKINKITKNNQWFEDNMPFAPELRKKKAKGVSGSYLRVVSMSGRTGPALPLGINLPNSAWIREVHGSQSVNLENSGSSRSSFDGSLREELYLPEYLPMIEKHGQYVSNLHTDLHEIIGHGSGETKPGVKKEDLGAFYSTIEEARADLAALYFMADPKLVEFQIFANKEEQDEATTAMYVSYFTNGSFAQLRRFGVDSKELTQAHFRNRQLIANWVLEKANPEKAALVKEGGKTYIKITDNEHVRELLGQLFYKIQDIKSYGNHAGAEELVMTYGTNINQDLIKEIHQRVKHLDIPNLVAFTSPIIEFNNEGKIELTQTDNFLEQQINLFKTYTPEPQFKNRNRPR